MNRSPQRPDKNYITLIQAVYHPKLKTIKSISSYNLQGFEIAVTIFHYFTNHTMKLIPKVIYLLVILPDERN